MNKEQFKKIGLGVGKYVGATAGGIILTALIKGEPLTGLAKLGGLAHLLNTGVPLWLLLILLLLCVWMAPTVYQALRKPRPKLYMSWNRVSSLWALGKYGETPTMQIHGDGLMTLTGTDEKVILEEAFIKGTKPIKNLVDPIPLIPDKPFPCRVITLLAPVTVKPDEDLVARLIFRDHKGRKYELSEWTFRSGNPPEISKSAEQGGE